MLGHAYRHTYAQKGKLKNKQTCLNICMGTERTKGGTQTSIVQKKHLVDCNDRCYLKHGAIRLANTMADECGTKVGDRFVVVPVVVGSRGLGV